MKIGIYDVTLTDYGMLDIADYFGDVYVCLDKKDVAKLIEFLNREFKQ